MRKDMTPRHLHARPDPDQAGIRRREDGDPRLFVRENFQVSDIVDDCNGVADLVAGGARFKARPTETARQPTAFHGRGQIEGSDGVSERVPPHAAARVSPAPYRGMERHQQMSCPVYTIRRMEISVLCDTPESEALSTLAQRRDRNGSRDSEWWGHPTFVGMPDGTALMRLPVCVHNLKLLHECGAVANPGDAETMRRLAFFKAKPAETESPLPLRPFQKAGMNWLLSRNLNGILAFDVGLGKSLTSIAAMLSDPDRFLPAVVMAPAHVKLNWEREWLKWGGDARDVVVLFGRTPDPDLLRGRKLIVLNHHILAGWADALIAVAPKTVVIDEAHNFVNSNTKTYPIVERVVRSGGDRVTMLTATPLVNNLGDLWGLCNLIRPDVLGNKGVFADTFMPEERAKAKLLASRWRGGFQARSGWAGVSKAKLPKALKERRIEELRDILHRTVMLRRRKSEVLDELPAITETQLQLDIPRNTPEGIAFWDIERECESDIANGKDDILASDRMLAAYTLAKGNAANAKLPYAIDWIRDWLDESEATEKLVVAGWSVEPLSKLHRHFLKQSVLVNGQIEAKKKHSLGEEFAADPEKRILFGNFKSIGTGIDQLVVARTMLLFELPLTAADFDQVKGRIDRLSQTAKALMYYYMTVRGSIEEKQGWKLIKSKQKLTSSLGL